MATKKGTIEEQTDGRLSNHSALQHKKYGEPLIIGGKFEGKNTIFLKPGISVIDFKSARILQVASSS